MKNKNLLFVLVPICLLLILSITINGGVILENERESLDENWKDAELGEFLDEMSMIYGFSDYGLDDFASNYDNYTYQKEVIIISDTKLDEEKLEKDITNKLKELNLYYDLYIHQRNN